ncbi:hypothetical protein HDU87_006280 [Geranomyces variabilis]|uniref:YTH domain-containing protein n=1 Tax=Geranomyces variabilis TaxID=109894 RepID=A0AAD5TL47_9FUNG|nr:hypothetical protein HDU87_006280 [Geranomyces variabilis]
MQQHRVAVAAAAWDESDNDDAASLPRRSSTSDLAVLEYGFENVRVGGGRSAAAFDERGLIDSSYSREGKEQVYPQHQQQQGYQVGGSMSAAVVLDTKILRQAMEFEAVRGINPTNFETRPVNSSYFVIKSNSTFNILASLAHNVWASTELGNRRLDAAFHAASQTNNNSNNNDNNVDSGGVYLFFSVTSSGRFCGVARMASGVDWDRVEAIWEGGKRYKGTFELEWIFVKDVPNAAVRHLKVSANENKPVSNSRDTQQVVEEIGHDMLRIFSQTSCTGHSALYDLFADPPELEATTTTTTTAGITTTGMSSAAGAVPSV